MPQPSNGITAEIIREIMPPYRLSQDLLAATLVTIPAPPPDATPAWRHARLTRLISEITAYRPADAAQARIAAQILGIRELADTITAQAHSGTPPLKELCRIARSLAELVRSANALERTVDRRQQKPVPFHGTVIQEEVDLKSLDAQWASRAPFTPAPDASPPSPVAAAPQPETVQPRPIAQPAAPPTVIPKPHHAAARAPAPTANPLAATPRPPEPTAHPTPAPDAPLQTRPAAPGSDWSITRLDSGPGWTREVLRHRSTAETKAAE